MTSETLIRSAMNDARDYDRVTFAVRHLRRAVDATARRVASQNAEWHDDPTAEDHEEFHAPADVQFPREARDEAILDLVRHYLTEIALSEQAKATQ